MFPGVLSTLWFLFSASLPCHWSVGIQEFLFWLCFSEGATSTRSGCNLRWAEETMKEQHFKLSLNPCPAGSKERSCTLPVLREQKWEILQQRKEGRADFCSLGAPCEQDWEQIRERLHQGQNQRGNRLGGTQGQQTPAAEIRTQTEHAETRQPRLPSCWNSSREGRDRDRALLCMHSCGKVTGVSLVFLANPGLNPSLGGGPRQKGYSRTPGVEKANSSLVLTVPPLAGAAEKQEFPSLPPLGLGTG